MTEHTPTLERLHAFEELDKSAWTAYVALAMFAWAMYAASVGEPMAAVLSLFVAGVQSRAFDHELDAAHCEYSTLRAEDQ